MNRLSKAIIEGQVITRAGHFINYHYRHSISLFENWIGNKLRGFYTNKIPVVNNRIAFCAFQGDYTDNPKYIAEELIRRNKDVELIWIGRKRTSNHPEELPQEFSKVLEWNTIEAYEALASAKVFILNSVEIFKKPYPVKPEQYIIETWHGSLGIKRFDRDANDGKQWVKAADRLGKVTDFLISNSTFETEIYRNTFWKNNEVLEYGHPRNDPIINCTEEQKKAVRAHLFEHAGREDHGEKLLLYAPTFRDSKDFSIYNLDAAEVKNALEARFGGEWLIMNRYHPTVRKYAKAHINKLDFVVDFTDYPDMQDLIQVADVGVTDYSSWIYDFMLTKRPGFIFARDLKAYYSERGFAYPLTDTPFPIATDNGMMADNIRIFDVEKYTDEVEQFLKGKGCIEDGHASERTVDKILELLEK